MLVGEPLDPEEDLYEADILTHNYIKKFENVKKKIVCFFLMRFPVQSYMKIRTKRYSL